ncbi:DNA polymerase III subunit alpha [Erysipelothrix aquatica]|uniref:DNA polymerase III subunit alpha n=1 Tax=Erysipelothrix aquatica TaxID=2683714 RepID=UPI001359339D|nr:DNA polymerase III subunit alpha [Erysipelothrix aquatica]
MIHLNVRSSYSLLAGLMSVETIVKNAKENNMQAVALTDSHVLFGALEFQKAAEKVGVKPLFGMEVTLSHEEETFTTTLLAKDNSGYIGLMHLSHALSQKSVLTFEEILTYEKSLIVIAHSEGGPFEKALLNQNLDEVKHRLNVMKQMFTHLYIGISHQESNFFRKTNSQLIDMAIFSDIEPVAMSKVYYELEGDEEAFRVVQAIGKGTYLEDKTLVSSPHRNFYSQEAMASMYDTRCLENTQKIADMCTVDVFSIKTSLPHFETGQAVRNDVYLSKLAAFGLSRRIKQPVNKVYEDRLEYELSVINGMNFTDYFLIVYDIIRYAKKEGIYVGPGRGSSAGSLVAYALGITEVDPIEYGLLFERFLNPERISMPDIDIDFPDDKRHLVIQYVQEKYGHNHVANIVTFGTLRARQAFRDVGRVLQIPIRTVDTGAKLISASTLQENYDNVPKFRTFLNSDKHLKRVFTIALKVEGLLRHASQHAAGVVMSRKPLDDVVPLLAFDEETHVTQYDMTYLEAIGLIKIDFLGLRNLTIIDNIARKINETTAFNIMKIPMDDAKTYQLLSVAETVGVFQLESDGMKALLKKLKPSKFMDIVDTIALYRPGPMENIPLYLASRKDPSSVKYLHPKLREITESTYGILIYQEQIMQVAQIMAGFTLGKADILRKAMGKKNAVELNALREDFINGCLREGHDRELANEIYDLIEKFANYGFNKSHSVAYGLIAYQLSYLKANYPHLFYTELLSSVLGSDVKTRQYIDECRRRNVSLLSVNLDHSHSAYTLDGVKIRMPFTIIKGISGTIAAEIEAERSENGSYKSFYDAVSRLNLVGVKKSHFEMLIKAGAMDYFGANRESMLASLEEAIRYANIIKVEKDGRKQLNFSLISEPIFTQVNENVRATLAYEHDLLGFYFSDHPTKSLKAKHGTDSLVQLEPRYEYYRVIGMIEAVKQHRAKNGKMMAFLQVSDDTDNKDVVVFNNVYEKIKDQLEVGAVVLIKVQVKETDSIIVQDMFTFEN